MRSDQPHVLISESRHATSFHVELGTSRLAACGKNTQADQEFTRVTLQEAREEYDREPCDSCPIPEEWLRPPYQRENLLREAYEETGSIKAAAERFDASYYTVREWLIEHGIHTPERRESYSTAAAILEKAREDEIAGGSA